MDDHRSTARASLVRAVFIVVSPVGEKDGVGGEDVVVVATSTSPSRSLPMPASSDVGEAGGMTISSCARPCARPC